LKTGYELYFFKTNNLDLRINIHLFDYDEALSCGVGWFNFNDAENDFMLILAPRSPKWINSHEYSEVIGDGPVDYAKIEAWLYDNSNRF